MVSRESRWSGKERNDEIGKKMYALFSLNCIMTSSQHEGLYWCVEFRIGRVNVRKWFAPLNGDIKPDTEHTQKLSEDAGWLASDSDE